MPRPKAYKIGKQKVVGTTTPINAWGGMEMEKVNNLCSWAQKLAVNYEYIDGELWHVPKYWIDERDARGRVGTAVHALWSLYLDPNQPEADLSELTNDQRDEVWKLYALLLEWLRKNPINPIAIEKEMVSRQYRYGGTPDVIDANNVIDVKTGYVNEFTCMLQCSSYNNLAQENNIVDHDLGGIILQPYEGQVRVYRFSPATLKRYFDTFLALLKTYNAEKQFNYMRKKKWGK